MFKYLYLYLYVRTKYYGCMMCIILQKVLKDVLSTLLDIRQIMSAKYGTSDYQTPSTTEQESANTEKIQSDNPEKEKLESREQGHPATDPGKVEDTAAATAIPIPEVNTLCFYLLH